MAALKFHGAVKYGDSYRVVCDDELEGSIWIGGRDLVAEVSEAKFSSLVTVGVADSTFFQGGGLEVDLGWGYSEFTPMDPDILKVGDRDLVRELIDRFDEGDVITLWISDEVIDLGAES